MIEVDINEIKIMIKKLESLKEKFYSNFNNYLLTLRESKIYLNDNVMDYLDSQIQEEEKSINLICYKLETKIQLLRNILVLYEKHGEKIKIKLENHEKIIKKIDVFINKIDIMINQIKNYLKDNAILDNYYINLEDIKNNMLKLKSKYVSFFDSINSIENEITSQIDMLETIVLKEKKILLRDNVKEKEKATLRENELLGNMEKLNYYLMLEKDSLIKFYEVFRDIFKYYKSNSVYKIFDNLEKEKDIPEILYFNQHEYINILIEMIDKYKNISNTIVSDSN